MTLMFQHHLVEFQLNIYLNLDSSGMILQIFDFSCTVYVKWIPKNYFCIPFE